MITNDKGKQISGSELKPITHKFLLPIHIFNELKALRGTDGKYTQRQFNVKTTTPEIRRRHRSNAEFHYKDHYGWFNLLVTDVHRTRVPGRCDIVVQLIDIKNESKPSTLEKEAFLNPRRRRDYY